MKQFKGKAIYNPSGRAKRKTKRSERVKSNGYYAVYVPDHPCAFGSGYVYEHRYIIEKQIGRYLTSSEIVHHRDGDRLNNSINNLELCSSIAEHKFEHRSKNSKVRKMPNEKNTMIECACGCGGKFLKYDENGRERKYYSGGCHMRHKKKLKQKIVLCACGCGTKIEKYDAHGRVRMYVSGHNNCATPSRNTLAKDSGFSFATIINYFRGNKLRNETTLLIEQSIIKLYGKNYLRSS